MKSDDLDRTSLAGQLLIAMPQMADERFAHSVIYLCAHSAEGAMGIIVNQRAPSLSFPELLRQLDIIPDDESIRLPAPADRMQVHRGGPVETGRGFVLHSPDYHNNSSTLKIDAELSLTATLDILKAIALGTGPSETFMALGYAGWGAGQLENEIQSNGWLHCDADCDLVFGSDLERKYDMALAKIGISPEHLSMEAGRA